MEVGLCAFSIVMFAKKDGALAQDFNVEVSSFKYFRYL
jgi:hypothetical protein